MIKTLAVLLSFSIFCGVAMAESNPKSKDPVVILETSSGVIKLELNQEKAPVTVENFLAYVNEGFYDGLIFHRVIKGFMVQGGGFLPEMKMKNPTRLPIKNEGDNGLKNDRGTVAMARTSVVDSATSQFFINVVDNTFLNHRDTTPRGYGYAVFGKVIEGMDVVDNIQNVSTGQVQRFKDVPLEPVIITKARAVEE